MVHVGLSSFSFSLLLLSACYFGQFITGPTLPPSEPLLLATLLFHLSHSHSCTWSLIVFLQLSRLSSTCSLLSLQPLILPEPQSQWCTTFTYLTATPDFLSVLVMSTYHAPTPSDCPCIVWTLTHPRHGRSQEFNQTTAYGVLYDHQQNITFDLDV